MKNINLNSISFNSIITKEDILKYVTQEQIYSYYLGENVADLGLFNSPLREDNIPSFALYFHKQYENTIMFKDLATGDCGDVFVLVMKLFNVSYFQALHKIASDLGLSEFNIDYTKSIIPTYTKITRKEKVELGIKVREWQLRDKNYWSSFGIKKATLEKYRVYPISHVFYNNTANLLHTLAYAYVEYKDGQTSYKIYQPLEIKTRKWINNANSTVHQGYDQLPSKGDCLIITKSLKDVMSIHDCTHIASIGLQSESVLIKDSVMEEYKSRFGVIICLFDNDAPGIKFSQEFTQKYGIPHIFMPTELGVKDFSDCVKSVGVLRAKEILHNKINNMK